MDGPSCDYLPRIVAWFQALPPEPVVKWTAACLTPDHQIVSGFIDVEVPPLLLELEVCWIWTIVPPEDDALLDELDVPVAYGPDGGWTPMRVSERLSRWVSEHVDRDDVHFLWDPALWSLVRQLVEDAAKTDEGDMIDIGDGVRATSEVMDRLLEMPWEDAAEITRAMQVRDGAPR